MVGEVIEEEAKEETAPAKKENAAADEKVVVKKEKIEDNPFDLAKATSFLNDPTS
jgi:hypothetical protein